MKVYKVDPDGQLVSPIDILKRLAANQLGSSDEFEVKVNMKICYKMSETGTDVKWSPEITITTPDGQEVSGFSHLGLGEEDLVNHLFAIGGKTKAGMTKGFEYEKVAGGFADNPDLFKPRKPPTTPPPQQPGVEVGEDRKKLMQEVKRTMAPKVEKRFK